MSVREPQQQPNAAGSATRYRFILTKAAVGARQRPAKVLLPLGVAVDGHLEEGWVAHASRVLAGASARSRSLCVPAVVRVPAKIVSARRRNQHARRVRYSIFKYSGNFSLSFLSKVACRTCELNCRSHFVSRRKKMWLPQSFMGFGFLQSSARRVGLAEKNKHRRAR